MAITKGTFKPYAAPAAAAALSISTTAFNTTAENLLIAACLFEGANTTCTFSDNQTGNTWAAATVTNLVNQFSIHCAMSWCVPVDVDASHTVTCTFGATRTQRRICVLPARGNFDASDALGATPIFLDGNGGSPNIGNLVTSAVPLLVCALGDNAGQTPAAGANWTKDSATAGSHFESRLPGASGTYAADWGADGYDWAGIAMWFKETAGGGGGGSILPLVTRGLIDLGNLRDTHH